MKVLAAALCFLLLASCGVKEPPLSERLKSPELSVKREAVHDCLRFADSADLAALVNLFEDKDLRGEAVKAAFYAGADAVVLNKMGSAADKAAFFYYFFLRASAGSVLPDAVIQADAGSAIFFHELALGTSDVQRLKNACTFFFDSDKTGLEECEKELILHIGKNRIKECTGFLNKVNEQSPGLAPFAKWALERIKTAGSVVKTDADRVIKKNSFFTKDLKNPVIPVMPGTFKSWHTANPDLLEIGDLIFFFYRGGDGTDRIALSTVPYPYFDAKTFSDVTHNPIVSTGKDSFDDMAVLDPAAIRFQGKTFLYYSGLGKGDDSVGLAVSEDKYNFVKAKKNPVITGRAPEVVLKDGVIYLFYVLMNQRGGYSVFLATSRDGYNFEKFSSKPVFEPAAGKEAWDGKTVTTPRIIEKGGVYYMLYCGDNKYIDYPPHFGIAFSHDLITWHRSTKNPVFSRGEKGEWDEGAIWYGQLYEYKNKWYLWYEGWGGAASAEREYAPGGRSQIGLATGEFDITDLL